MAPIFEKNELVMLEDLILLAKEGKDVRVQVQLRKQDISQKVHTVGTAESKAEFKSYLLIADYTCSVAGEVYEVPKVYLFGSEEESLTTAKMHKNIANERLKRDYQRLKDATIKIEEKYF
jgi:aromatic ring hydroxylase